MVYSSLSCDSFSHGKSDEQAHCNADNHGRDAIGPNTGRGTGDAEVMTFVRAGGLNL